MNGQEQPSLPPLIEKEQRRARRVRVVVVRTTIVVLAITLVLLLWRPWDALDDCVRCASRNGHPLMVRYYLWRGEDVNVRGGWGTTPLMEAAWNGHTEVVDLLVRRGASLDLVDNEGKTALIWAARQGYDETTAYLVHQGASLNYQDKDGNTALIDMLQCRQVRTARLLLRAGAHPGLTNREGETALMKAKEAGYESLLPLLSRHGTIKSDVFVGASPFPAGALTPARLWALGTTALLVQYNGDSHELLGSRPASDQTWARKALIRWWNVTNRQQAIGMLDWLEKTGHRKHYQAESRWPKRRRRPLEPYLAWDYCRFVWVAGVSSIAGYLSEDEVWIRIMPVARAIQANYSSWQEMGEDYLRGRALWNGKRDPQFEQVFRMLINPRDPTSPWNKNKWDTDLSQ